MPRPVIMPLVHGELVGLIWVRPMKVGEDALTGIAELANIAATVAPDWRPAPAPQPGGELVPPIQAAVNFAFTSIEFTPIELDHPDPFGVTVSLMEEDGYSVRLTEAFTR
ncbi:hypothetical protein [Streptomyces scopuliridis]|uniref:hypothetical protein n=1 Tax=Streptomyces scopuliridis TaxID=452529 RepID=UPI0036A094A0